MILNYSSFYRNMKNILPIGLVLLGDSGYKVTTWMMVPYDDSIQPLTAAQSL